ncbi:hypothetical protein M9Y10_020431 [Tritrichomonas musculus]|uniref:2Fe-2S ferredoxin-type domain-containing protein n=1 Tax=Tritrichomonas musculus TaxID=1915356 RepID=A0ABR2HG91_9EUKA
MLSSATKANHCFFFSKIQFTVNGKKFSGDVGDSIRHFLIKNQMPVCVGTCNTCKVFVDGEPKLACSTPIKDGMNITTKAKTDKKEIIEQMQQVVKAPNFF